MNQKKLLKKIIKASNLIHDRSLKGSANFIIVSSELAEIIENLDIKKHRKKKLIEIMKKASE
jgi:hypothetical protein